jgi:hypothetical protein
MILDILVGMFEDLLFGEKLVHLVAIYIENRTKNRILNELGLFLDI